MKPRTAAEVRALLDRRSTSRPRNAAPPVTVAGSTATIRLFDAIDSWGEVWGMSAAELAETLDGLPASVSTIEVLINSPGGDVFDGIAMVNTLRAHPARVVAVVQGLAASAASFIAVTANETVMMPNSELMIHNAWGACVGDDADMTAMAQTLDRLSDNIADMYTAKAGGSRATWRQRMRAETWYPADDAVAVGLADRVQRAGTQNRAVNAREQHDADTLALLALSGPDSAQMRKNRNALALLDL